MTVENLLNAIPPLLRFLCSSILHPNRIMDAYYVYPPLGATTLFHHSDAVPFTLYVPEHHPSFVAEVWTDLAPNHHWHALPLILDPRPHPVYAAASAAS